MAARLAPLLVLHGEIPELVVVGADDLVGDSEGEVTEAKEARRGAGGTRAHKPFIAIALDAKQQGLALRGHVEATV